MSNQINQATNMTNYVKDVWAEDYVEELVSEAVLVKELSTAKDAKVLLGGQMQLPLVTAREQGISYGRTFDTTDARAGIRMNVTPATVTPPLITIQSLIGSDLVEQTEKGGKTSYGSAFDTVLESQLESLLSRAEVDFLYGGEAWAVVNGTPTVTSTTHVAVVLANKSDTFLNTLLNAELDFYSADFATRHTANGPAIVTGYDMENSTLSVIAFNGTDANAIASTDNVVGYNSKGNTVVGLLPQISFRGTTFYGANNTTISSLQGQVYSTSAAFNMGTAQTLVAKAAAFLPKGTLTCFVSYGQFGALGVDATGQIRWPKGGDDITAGFPAIDVIGAGVKAEIRPHAFLKDADALVFPMGSAIVAGQGTLDIYTSTSAGPMVTWLPNKYAYAASAGFSAQPMLTKPNQCVRATALTAP